MKSADEDWRYPLRYPDGVERTPRDKRQMFQPLSRWRCQSVGDARDCLLSALKTLGAKNVTVSSNVPVNGHGKLSGNSREPEDVGVAVYFRLDKTEMELCCDRWLELKDNLQALSIQVEILIAQREIEGSVLMQKSRTPHQHGKSEASRQQKHQRQARPRDRGTYSQGQQRQTPPARWADTLGVKPTDSLEAIRKAYRLLARKHHTDVGGDEEMMKRINNAWEEAKRIKTRSVGYLPWENSPRANPQVGN
ncbi:J domain-containing protein [Pantanalinema sp. GBBB05]|uniref:J domain-containing protein n=1 Tax=Pantanalinema sp. GBBB05 TaxID=2604139 RepID=UPI001E0477E9|nr:J domain-containing protein [Pantanalinema sp. GBBB05]